MGIPWHIAYLGDEEIWIDFGLVQGRRIPPHNTRRGNMDCGRWSGGKAARMWPSLTTDIQWVLDEYERSKDDVVVVTLTSRSVIYGVRRPGKEQISPPALPKQRQVVPYS
jgi:hypothetical protein